MPLGEVILLPFSPLHSGHSPTDCLQNVWVGPKEMDGLAQCLIYKQSGDVSYYDSNTMETFHSQLLVVLSLSAPTPTLLTPPPKANNSQDVVRL